MREAVAVMGAFSARLEANRRRLDALNVFPIADNDTGTNMSKTLTSIVSVLDDATDPDAAAGLVASAALDGRGNSGLIIGQYLAGFFSASDVDRIDLARGLDEGARWARRAVARPVEGTMLTVADAAAEALRLSPSLPLDDLAVSVAAAVEATQTQLAALSEHGVVDSGAAGLLLLFEALCDVVDGGAPPSSIAPADVIACNVGLEAAGHHGQTIYEIQFRVPAALVSGAELRSLLVSLGTDVVVASSVDELSAHLHVSEPHHATATISEMLEVRPGAAAISYSVEAIIESGPPT